MGGGTGSSEASGRQERKRGQAQFYTLDRALELGPVISHEGGAGSPLSVSTSKSVPMAPECRQAGRQADRHPRYSVPWCVTTYC